MPLENSEIQQILIKKFGTKIEQIHQMHEMLTVEVSSEALFELMKFLKQDHQLSFNFLTDVCGVHYPDYSADKTFCVVYHLHNWQKNVRIRVKAFLPNENPEIDSVVSLYPSANWQERETYDFYGIRFKNHPQLKRILNMDEMESFPLRKEFPMEDGGRSDKDDRFFGRTNINC